ncbi:MAG: class A beta-lactamase-related serine hydrolase [Anaerolineaceae bacterium]|nr:class A beta-lactamase-related serine hydrolase [Anaerolineaceae bacterium]
MTFQEKIQNCIPDKNIELGISVHHIESGEETNINAHAIFPTASVFKVPVMVEVYKQAREGKFDLGDRLGLKTKDKTLTTGVLLTLQDGLMLTIRDLMMLMTIVSDNTATTMLMDLVGAQNTTDTMRSLGLDTINVVMTVHEMFLYAFGIPEQNDINLEDLRVRAKEVQMDYNSRTFSRGIDNNVSSALDMTRLMAMIFKGEVVDREACDEMLKILQNQQYNSRVPRYLPWRSVYHKTGTMRGLRNDSGIITCKNNSHAAFTVYSFDQTTLPLGDFEVGEQRSSLAEKMMADIGRTIYEHY